MSLCLLVAPLRPYGMLLMERQFLHRALQFDYNPATTKLMT